MRPYWRFLPVFISFIPLTQAQAQDFPVSAEDFLRSLEPSPGVTMLYDFFDVYEKPFSECRENPAQIRALGYIARAGGDAFVRQRLTRLSTCSNLTDGQKVEIGRLSVSVQATAAPVQIDPPPETPVATATPTVPAGSPVAAEEKLPGSVINMPTPPAAPVSPAIATSITVTPVPVPPAKPAVPRREIEPAANRTITPLMPRPPLPVVKTGLSVNTPQLTLARPAPAPLQDVAGQRKTPAVSPLLTSLENQSTYRSGDRGTSRLLRMENTASMRSGAWTAGVTGTYLNSFGPDSDAETGSAAPYNTPKRHSLKTEDLVVTPQISYTRDTLSIILGTTPFGGTVAPLPAFNVQYKDRNLTLQAFQEPVKDSLLSYVGFRDVNGDGKMGRVVKAGIKLGWEDVFNEHWFYGGGLTGSYFYGKNVQENKAVKAEAYVGRNFGFVSLGLYSSLDHFQRDLNHFTYGHGGYYSPHIAAAAAGFASWEVKGNDSWLKTDLSLGYLYEKTRDTSWYFKGGGSGPDYEGEQHNRFTINTGIEAGLKLTETASLSGSVRYLKSGPFHEGKAGINISFAF